MKTRVQLQLSKGRKCSICGINDGSIVPAHYGGIRQHQYGKGMGTKCNDLFTADLCRSCHAKMDQPKQRKSIEASEEFLHAIVMTLYQDWLDGRLIFK